MTQAQEIIIQSVENTIGGEATYIADGDSCIVSIERGLGFNYAEIVRLVNMNLPFNIEAVTDERIKIVFTI